MKKTIISILGIVILATISMTAYGQTVTSPLPRLIQNLSDEDYVVWAQWQNRQASRRSEVLSEDTSWMRYNYVDQQVSNSYSRSNATMRTSATSNVTNNSSTRSGTGWSNQSGSRSTSQRGSASANVNRLGGTTTTAYKLRFLNPDYVGPGAVSAYNPWVRYTGGLGTPDWGSIFVPCKKGTITMQEILDQLIGPHNPEKVFETMMEGYLGN